jgi:hypothetical protein
MSKLLHYAMRPGYVLGRVMDAIREPKEASWADSPKVMEALDGSLGGLTIPKIAVVKQEVYQDLYCCPYGSALPDLISSSLKRSGPVAFFSRLGADFWIVKTEDDTECNIWRQKCTDCLQASPEHYESLKTKPFKNGEEGHTQAQGEFSVPGDSIPWEQYDIVVSFDISVPARITRKYPKTVWAYCLGEPCMSAYSASHKEPIVGYDLFLNQRFRLLPVGYTIPAHEIEFPYYFQYYGCFGDVYGPEAAAPEGIMLEVHTN